MRRLLWKVCAFSVILYLSLGWRKSMDKCKEVQHYIEDFDKGNLSLKKECEFVAHINQCEYCREELEIYYIIKYGLDESEDKELKSFVNLNDEMKLCLETFDFTSLVDLKLKQSVKKCENIKTWNRYNKLRYILVQLIMIFTIIVFLIIRFY